MYKIMFFDLDGTLLTDEKEVLEENKVALKRAQENGIEIALCSGRQKNFIEKYKEAVGTGDYIISTNGSGIYDLKNNEEIFACEVDKNLVYNLYNLSIQNEYLIRLDTRYARYVNTMKYSIFDEISMEEEINSFLERNKILQVTIGTKSEENTDKIIEYLKEKSYVKVENKYPVNINNETLWMINVINTSVSKGNAISGLCKYLKINLQDAIAFGDDLNDISMMKTVGMGVAMENAMPEVKELAKVVIGHNNRPSIAEFIDKIIEENKNS